MNIFKRIVRIVCYVVTLGAIVFMSLTGFHDDRLEVLKYEYVTEKIKEPFKAVVVSDLHHRKSLDFQGGGNLVKAIQEEKPNIILLCGDLVDDWNDKELKNQVELLDGIKSIPTYYITGNHEHRSPHFKSFMNLVNARDWVHYIDDQCVELSQYNVCVYGLHDKTFDKETRKETGKTYDTLDKQLETFGKALDKNKFNIILTHNPANINKIKQYGYDAVMSGHTHGGQLRLGNWSPLAFVHGPNSYNAGEYKIDNKDNQRLYVSKGLGYAALFPIRVNCRPDIISISFKK